MKLKINDMEINLSVIYKKVILVILLLIGFQIFGQHKYMIEVDFSVRTSSPYRAWGITFYYVEGTTNKIIRTYSSIIPTTQRGSGSYTFTTTNPIRNIRMDAFAVVSPTTTCDPIGVVNANIQNFSPIIPFNGCEYNSSSVKNTLNRAITGHTCITGSVSTFRLIKIEDFASINNYSAINDEIKSCDSKRILMPTSCNYALEYKIPNNADWEELLPYRSNPSFVNISKSDFRGLYINQNLQIRVRYLPNKGETDRSAYSDILTYKITDCSPPFRGLMSENTSCSYKENGSFELKVARDLDAGEKLAITIYEKDTGNVPSGGQNLSITTLTANSDGTFSYKWPEKLPSNTYEIKYQTGSTSEDLSNSFDTLEVAGEIDIKSPKPVTFSLTQASDKTCFSRNDGYIDVEADGENGRTFFYQLLKDGVVQRVSGQEWIPFTNAKTTRIARLGEAKYRVKVQDSEKCFFRR